MKYLTDLEQKAVKLLAEEKSYEAIKRECYLSTLKLCPFLGAIRRKTGIADTKDAQQVRDYITKYEAAANGPGPSPLQMEVINRLMGVGYPEHELSAIDYRMGLSPGSAYMEYEAGLNAAGIYATTASERTVQCRMFLASLHVRPTASMLNDNHLRALRLYAQNEKEYFIAQQMPPGFNSIPAVEMLIQDGVDRLGVVARGRGVQRRLVGIALDRLEQEKSKTLMNDPMF